MDLGAATLGNCPVTTLGDKLHKTLPREILQVVLYFDTPYLNLHVVIWSKLPQVTVAQL